MRPRGATVGTAMAAVALTMLTGCFFNAFDALQNLDSPLLNPRVEVEYVIRGSSGDDAVNVYAEEPGALARQLATPLGIQNPVFADTDVGFTEIRDQGRDRLITRTDGRWSIRIDVAAIKQTAASQGIDRFRLAVCHPAAEVRVQDPPLNESDALCEAFGRAWDIERNDSPLTMTLEIFPSEGSWNAFLIGIGVWYGIFCIVFLVVGRVMRRDLPRAGGGMVPVALILGVLGCAMGMLITFGIAATAGPADNLALIRDYDVGRWLRAVLAPSAGAFAPWVVLALTLIWGRPWRRRRLATG